MNVRRLLLVIGMPVVLVLSFCKLCGGDYFIANGVSVSSYGTGGGSGTGGPRGAFLITSLRELMEWDNTVQKWVRRMILTPEVRQMDCLTDGTRLMGTDNTDKVWQWNGLNFPAGDWDEKQAGKKYHWAILDPVTDEARGMLKQNGIDNIWDSWDKPTGGDWDRYISAGEEGTQRMKTLILVDTKSPEFHRWQRGDTGYRIGLNREGGSTPFKIFAYTDEVEYALERMTGPPAPTPLLFDATDPDPDVVNPNLVLAAQISYDEVDQNLWCIDDQGRPWHWNNEYQGWELRNRRGEAPYRFPEVTPECSYFRQYDDYYVRTTYIQGEYKPVVIILKDSMVLHLLVGELSKGDIRDATFYFVEEPRRSHKFHTILQRPHETPQKLVRVDSDTVRVRENHFLERIMIQLGIVARHEDIGVYPSQHHLIRR